jgi:hydroxymethylpyrimidine/phosphomethylpyrimidine kinase
MCFEKFTSSGATAAAAVATRTACECNASGAVNTATSMVSRRIDSGRGCPVSIVAGSCAEVGCRKD